MLSGERNHPRLRRAALANSGRLRHRAVGQTPPRTPLYLFPEGIAPSRSLVAMPDPAHLGLGFRQARLFSGACRGTAQSNTLCAVTARWGVVVKSFFRDCGVPPPWVAQALPRRRGATATADRYESSLLPSSF